MALKSPVGDGNKLYIYALSTANNFDTLLYTFDKSVSCSLSGHPLKESLIIDIDSKTDDESLGTFYASYLHNYTVEKSDVEYTNSDKDTLISGVSGLTADGKDFGFIWHGATDGSKTKVAVGRGILSGDTGNVSYSPKSLASAAVQITAISGVQVAVPAAKFDSTKVTVSATLTVPTTAYGCIAYYTTP